MLLNEPFSDFISVQFADLNCVECETFTSPFVAEVMQLVIILNSLLGGLISAGN